MDAARASAIVEQLHDWPARDLLEVFRRVKGNTWAEAAVRGECDLREIVARVGQDDGSDDHADPVLDLDDTLFVAYWALEDHFGERCADETADGLTREWLEQCVRDGWYAAGGALLERLSRRQRLEVLSRTVSIGPVSLHTPETRVLRSEVEHMARLPHPLETLPDPPDMSVPGPFVEQQAEAERQRLERDKTEALPVAARLAQTRLAVYRQAYEDLVEARLAAIVPFVLGRFDRADWNHGTSRRRRPEERQAAVEAAHAIATKCGSSVRHALLSVSLERLHREREFWSEMSWDKPTRTIFADACLPLSVEIVRLLEDHGLENRPLQGAATHSGALEANVIANAARWETDRYGAMLSSAPLAELRAIKEAASNLREGDWRLAMTSEKSEGWLTSLVDKLRNFPRGTN
jgi:hypothetical protein